MRPQAGAQLSVFALCQGKLEGLHSNARKTATVHGFIPAGAHLFLFVLYMGHLFIILFKEKVCCLKTIKNPVKMTSLGYGMLFIDKALRCHIQKL